MEGSVGCNEAQRAGRFQSRNASSLGIEFSIDVLKMCLDGFRGDIESKGYFLIAETICQLVKNVDFPVG